MRSFKSVYSKVDEYYTPKILVDILLPYLDEKFHGNGKFFCPFDMDNSEYVLTLKESGYDVINGHIDNGQDFFSYDIPADIDMVISNPPFSRKLDVFKKCINENKPFALLMNMMAINYQEIGDLFASIGKDIQFLIPDKKVSFNGKTSSFCSGYVCYKFIEQTEFIHLPHNNCGINFVPSRMDILKSDKNKLF